MGPWWSGPAEGRRPVCRLEGAAEPGIGRGGGRGQRAASSVEPCDCPSVSPDGVGPVLRAQVRGSPPPSVTAFRDRNLSLHVDRTRLRERNRKPDAFPQSGFGGLKPPWGVQSMELGPWDFFRKLSLGSLGS